MDIRIVTYKNSKYLHCEDVIELLLDFAATEPTDTRNRMNELINNIKGGESRD